MSVHPSNFIKLPYIDAVPDDGRQIVMRGFFDHESKEWVLHIPHGEDLIRMQGGETVRGSYYAREPADPDRDLLLSLSTMTSMHLSFPGVQGPVSAIEADLHHFCSLLEAYEILSAHPPGQGLPDILLAQFEALVLIIRQVYDHLQKVSQQLCKHVLDPATRTVRVINDLPPSFARIVLHGDNEPRTAAEISEHFRLPEPISRFYEDHALRFRALRDLRVSIEHHGATPETIFQLEQGAAVIGADEPWAILGPWPPTLYRGKFVSLRGIFAHLILHTIALLDDFATAFTSQIAVPTALSPEVRVFLRNPLGAHLVQLPSLLDAPWEKAPPGSAPAP